MRAGRFEMAGPARPRRFVPPLFAPLRQARKLADKSERDMWRDLAATAAIAKISCSSALSPCIFQFPAVSCRMSISFRGFRESGAECGV
jgi:hypothetical protein